MAISIDPSSREGEGIRQRHFFPRARRLDSAGAKRLLDHGKRFGAEAAPIKLSARVLRRADVSAMSEVGAARLAIAVPKRLLKRAVDRNRAKRVVREAFRLSVALTNDPQDMMVTLVSSPKRLTRGERATRTAMRSAVQTLFTAAASNTRTAPAENAPRVPRQVTPTTARGV